MRKIIEEIICPPIQSQNLKTQFKKFIEDIPAHLSITPKRVHFLVTRNFPFLNITTTVLFFFRLCLAFEFLINRLRLNFFFVSVIRVAST